MKYSTLQNQTLSFIVSAKPWSASDLRSRPYYCYRWVHKDPQSTATSGWNILLRHSINSSRRGSSSSPSFSLCMCISVNIDCVICRLERMSAFSAFSAFFKMKKHQWIVTTSLRQVFVANWWKGKKYMKFCSGYNLFRKFSLKKKSANILRCQRQSTVSFNFSQ